MSLGAEIQVCSLQRSRFNQPGRPQSGGRSFSNARHGVRAGRVGEQVERHLLVVTDGCERAVTVSSSGRIARDDKFEHKEARNRYDDDGMFAGRFPDEPRLEADGAFAPQAQADA